MDRSNGGPLLCDRGGPFSFTAIGISQEHADAVRTFLMKFDFILCLARMVNAVLATLPVSGGAGWVADDWRLLAVGAGTAALGALRTDVDSYIRAKEMAAEEARKEAAKKALHEAEQRLPDGAIVVQESVPALVSVPAGEITKEEILKP